MKFKTKTKDRQMIIRIKIPSELYINEQELTLFSRKFFRGFLKPKQIKHNLLEYTGPIGIIIKDRLDKPINKHDFFFIIEQIVDNTQKLQKNGIPWNKVIWNIENSYINEVTKELQLIYLPLSVVNPVHGDVMTYIESIIYSAQPVGEHDLDFVSRFVYFLRTINVYDPEKIEAFIKKEDRDVVNTIKKHSTNGSGFITDKPRHYHEHYENKKDEEATNHLTDAVKDEATGLLTDETEDDVTGRLTDTVEDDVTGRLTDTVEDDATGLLTDDGDDEATGLLVENKVNYPSLYRVLTNETIYINKPVFRVGKEKSYVDYFVTNNSAVSRSHADIVVRGSRYFVIDLNSKNRTYINGKMLPVHYETEILDGDSLKLANEEFIFKA